MAISFRYNDTTYELFSDVGEPITSPNLNIVKDVAGLLYKFNVPLLTSREQRIGSYIYKAPSPTICVRHNNTTYYCARSREAVSEYDIPAGTYTPSAFENLISQYISANGSRNCVNAFTAKVNGITYNVSAGQAIKYCTTNTAGSGTNSTLRIVTFNGRNTVEAWDAGTFKGTYVVHASNFSGLAQFSAYANYSITIGTGIIFN